MATPMAATREGATVDENQPPVLDPSELNEICDDGDPVRGQLTTMLLDQARSAITALTAAIAAGDATTIERTAHALKGSAAILGARRLAAISGELCDCAASNQLADAPRQLAILEHVYDLTTVAMSPNEPPV
jgi:two-component system, sensor histidine kinase and response regulator